MLAVYDPFAAADAAGEASDRIKAPMPGKIVQLLVKPGDTVDARTAAWPCSKP